MDHDHNYSLYTQMSLHSEAQRSTSRGATGRALCTHITDVVHPLEISVQNGVQGSMAMMVEASRN